MIIVLEGPDGGGKTTLASQLEDFFTDNDKPVLYLHARYHQTQWIYDAALMRRAIKASELGHVVIMDRSWIGDNLYSRIYRGHGGGTWVRQSDALLRRYGAVYVFCLPDKDTVLKAHAAKHTAGLEKYDTVDKVFDAYYDLWHGDIFRWNYPHNLSYIEQLTNYGGWKNRDDGVLYNWKKDSIDELIAQIYQRRNRNSLTEAIPRHVTGFRGGIRRWHNMYLFVTADAPQEKCSMPYPQFGPQWFQFSDIVNYSGMPETHLCYVSTQIPGSISITPKLVHSLMPECKVVAVGNAGKYDCERLDLPIWRTIPYPVIQDENQFRRYVLLLKEVFLHG